MDLYQYAHFAGKDKKKCIKMNWSKTFSNFTSIVCINETVNL